MIELLEHNVETYQNLCKEMEKHNKVALIQATGTGKSYIISKYIEEHCHNALILVPTNAIGDQWQKLLSDVEVRTYQAMAKGIDGEYDLIVADEMHHLGSDVWGQKFIEYFMQNPGQKVIGATATEIRYLDNARDMTEEIFDGIAVRGVDLATAIDKGILPTFKYITSYLGTEDDYNAMREKCNMVHNEKKRKDLSTRLEMCIKNQVSIKEAMLENLNMNSHRIIVFLNGICEIDEAIKTFGDIFPGCECHSVHVKKSRDTNKAELKAFQDSTAHITLLFAIDMLNEGIHVNGADCIVMFRNTISPQVYFQQLGRALSSGKKDTPTIFDFSCNHQNIKECSLDFLLKVKKQKNADAGKMEKRIIIKSYEKDLDDVLDEIKICLRKTNREALNEQEKSLILRMFKDAGGAIAVSKIAREVRHTRKITMRFLREMYENTDTMKELDKQRCEFELYHTQYQGLLNDDKEMIRNNYKTKSILELAMDCGSCVTSVRKYIKQELLSE